MITLYSEYRISNIIELSKTLKLLVFKSRETLFPGQFFMIYIKGIGESQKTPILIEENTLGILIEKEKNSIDNALYSLKEKDSIFLRGPYGKGYPMNNLISRQITIISDGSNKDVDFSLLGYNNFNKTLYKTVHLLSNYRIIEEVKNKINIFGDVENVYVEDLYNLPNEAFKETSKDSFKHMSIIFLNISLTRLKDMIFSLKQKGVNDKLIYFYFPRKISCGTGICGTCASKNIHTCIDGPVFRADSIDRVF